MTTPFDDPPVQDAWLSDVVTHLVATELFSQLPLPVVGLLAPIFLVEHYAVAQVVAEAGEVDDHLRIVIRGAVSEERWHEDGMAEQVRFLGYGSVFGMRGVFAGLPRETVAVAAEATDVLSAERESLWQALGGNDEAMDRLILTEAVRQHLRRPGEAMLQSVPGEYEVATFRHHWVVLAQRMLGPAALLVLLLIATGLAAPIVQQPAIILVMAALALVLPVVAAGWAFWDYWLDRFIVTNRRLIEIQETPFLDSGRQETFLTNVQDVQIRIPNLPARLLGYGTITAQTSGTRGSIRFHYVPRPEAVRQIVFGQLAQAREYAHRERQAFITGQIRQALGYESIAAAAQRDAPVAGGDAPVADAEASTAKPFGQLVLEALARTFAYFWPRMRLEVGGTVTWRKHWWWLFKRTGGLMVALVALPVVYVGMSVSILGPAGTPAGAAGLGGLALLIWLGLFLTALWQYEDWRNDLYQLTDSHIIDIERRPLGSFEQRRQAALDKIQDVRYVKPSPFAWLLNFGSVSIETAAELGSFSFDYVHDPSGVQQDIQNRIESFHNRQQREKDQRQAEEFARWLAEYHRLTGGPTERGAAPGS